MTNPFLGKNLNLRKISFIFRFGPLADNWSNKRVHVYFGKMFHRSIFIEIWGAKNRGFGRRAPFILNSGHYNSSYPPHCPHRFSKLTKRMDNVQKTERDWNSCQIEKQTKWSNLKRAQPLSPWVSNNRLIGFWLIRFSSGLKVNITLHAKFSYQ